MTRLILTLALTFSAFALTACNTIEGAGEDIQAVGEGTSDAARDTKDAIKGE